MSGSAIAMMIVAMVLLWGGSAYFLSKIIKSKSF
ncbi:MetS family NSS transporter small subunit [Desulfotruncus arcticus]|nr:MetS family NSS transporter small subunit [Desulfotruncus arcticus]